MKDEMSNHRTSACGNIIALKTEILCGFCRNPISSCSGKGGGLSIVLFSKSTNRSCLLHLPEKKHKKQQARTPTPAFQDVQVVQDLPGLEVCSTSQLCNQDRIQPSSQPEGSMANLLTFQPARSALRYNRPLHNLPRHLHAHTNNLHHHQPQHHHHRQHRRNHYNHISATILSDNNLH